MHAQRELPAPPTASAALTAPADTDTAPPARSTTPLNAQKSDLAKNPQAQAAAPELQRRSSGIFTRAFNTVCGTRYMTSCAGTAGAGAGADANANGEDHAGLSSALAILLV